MNNDVFQLARAAYSRKDFEEALSLYTKCLQDSSEPLGPGEMGQLYHQIGNCLIKLRNHNEAIQAYTQATADADYDACGALNYNLGMAYAALHDYEGAVKYFEIAVSDAKYDAVYKAYSGMGSALLKMGKSAEAGVAFRESALSEGNPDPTKALLNLGVCFMALDRPADAVASYESALQFAGDSKMRNRLYANLGQAYVACGQMQKASAAFEQAIADKTYFLSDSASVDYQRAIAAVAQGTTEISQNTQVMAPIPAGADMSGLDVAADGSGMYVDQDPYNVQASEGFHYVDPYGYEGPYGTAAGDQFFTASDAEIEKWSKGLAKQDRKRRNVGLKILVSVFFIVLMLFAGAVFLYTQGWGFPTQESVAYELFANPEQAKNSVFAADVTPEVQKQVLACVTPDSSPTINGVEKAMTESLVYVTAKTSEGAEVQYKVSMVRDQLGWKISNVELYFPSQN